MTENAILEHLEHIAEKLGIELRYENLNAAGLHTPGGFCKLMGKPMILVNRNDSRRRKILVLAKSLNRLNLEGMFIPPAIRRLIENQDM
jgi:hypothetical protein